MGEIIEFTYEGAGRDTITLPVTLHKKPKILFISGNGATGFVLTTPGVGFSIANNMLVLISEQRITSPLTVVITETKNGFSAMLTDTYKTMNASGKTYSVTAIC